MSDKAAKYFWQQMVYVVAGAAIMCLGVLLLDRV